MSRFNPPLLLDTDAYEAAAPPESDRWATTDRGWCRDPGHPDRDGYAGNLPIGNYLDYGPCGEHHRQRPEGAVHAAFTPWYLDHLGKQRRDLGASKFCKTPEDAVLWILAQYRAWCDAHERAAEVRA